MAQSFPVEEAFKMDSEFPSDADFNETDEVAIPWREVVYNTPLKIMKTRNVFTKNGDAMIVKLQTRDGTIINAWTTKLIRDSIMEKLSSEDKQKSMYIMSCGLKTSQKTKNTYYDFKIISK